VPYLLNYYNPTFPTFQGPSAGPYGAYYPPPGLGFYRPNQAFFRGRYPGASQTLGQSIDPTSINLTDPMTLLSIVGIGFVVWNLFKSGRRVRRSVGKYRRSRRRRAQTKRRIRDLELDLPYGGAAGR
jgi:hypothetical protein